MVRNCETAKLRNCETAKLRNCETAKLRNCVLGLAYYFNVKVLPSDSVTAMICKIALDIKLKYNLSEKELFILDKMIKHNATRIYHAK